MRKNLIILWIAIIGFMVPINTTFATEIYVADSAMQGSTLKIEIPAYDISKISGSFEDNPVLFYKINRLPKPAETISRAEFLEMMFLNHDFGEVDYSEVEEFPDVDEESEYYEYIMKAAALGIINGYEDGKFHPFRAVTRGQIAKILVNAFANSKVARVKVSSTTNVEVPPIPEDFTKTETHATPAPNTTAIPTPTPIPTSTATSSPSQTSAENQTPSTDLSPPSTPTFPDVPQNHRFYNYINQSVSAAWFKGYPDGYMRPDRHINYSEAEIVITRAALPPEFTQLGEKPYYLAYTGIDRKLPTGVYNLSLIIKSPHYDNESKIIPINVTTRDVPTIRFSLSKEKTDLFGKDAQDKTWNAVYGALSNPIPTQLWEGKFIVPTTGEITLGFGDKLYINGVYSGSHFGIDYANNLGTPIYASNQGIITLSEYTPAFGNTVVIDHGHNIFTMYIHMSELKAEKGAQVNKGDLIGLMGSTGISTGSHLHFTQFIGDVIVNSDEWVYGEI